jgi:hypothetical protein
MIFFRLPEVILDLRWNLLGLKEKVPSTFKVSGVFPVSSIAVPPHIAVAT